MNLNFTHLHIDNKKITEVSKKIQFLTNLQYSWLDNNKITVIPKKL